MNCLLVMSTTRNTLYLKVSYEKISSHCEGETSGSLIEKKIALNGKF